MIRISEAEAKEIASALNLPTFNIETYPGQVFYRCMECQDNYGPGHAMVFYDNIGVVRVYCPNCDPKGDPYG